jgi:hypothetical protein
MKRQTLIECWKFQYSNLFQSWSASFPSHEARFKPWETFFVWRWNCSFNYQ